jgi:hypothetical protein
MPDIVTISSGPYAEGSTPLYTGQIIDIYRNGVPASNLTYVVLSIVDKQTDAVINGVDSVNILNADRGTVDASGNLSILLRSGDTSMSEVPGQTSVWRSLIIKFLSGNYVGRHKVNFLVASLGISP